MNVLLFTITIFSTWQISCQLKFLLELIILKSFENMNQIRFYCVTPEIDIIHKIVELKAVSNCLGHEESEIMSCASMRALVALHHVSARIGPFNSL